MDALLRTDSWITVQRDGKDVMILRKLSYGRTEIYADGMSIIVEVPLKDFGKVEVRSWRS